MPKTYVEFVALVHVHGRKAERFDPVKRRREAVRKALARVSEPAPSRFTRQKIQVRAEVREVSTEPWLKVKRRVVWRAERKGEKLQTWETLEA